MKKILLLVLLVAGTLAAQEGSVFNGTVFQLNARYTLSSTFNAATNSLQSQIDQLVSPTSGITQAYADANYLAIGWSNNIIAASNLAATAIQPNTTAALYAVAFNTAITNTLAEGQLGWNAEDGTLDVGMVGGNVTLQIGQEDYIRARNESGSTLTNGWVVYQTGFSGNKPLIDVHNGGHAPLGITTETIAKNNNGYVTLRGLVRDVNTSAYALNAELYASTNGAAITNRPAYPTDAFQVGRVAKAHATEGVILAQTPTCAKTWSELDEQYRFVRSYGSIYRHDSTNAINITTAGVYYIVGNMTTNGFKNCTLTSSGIVIQVAGTYEIEQYASFSGQANTTYEGSIFINGQHQEHGEFERKLGAGGDIGAASSGGIYTLASNDVVALYVEGSSTGIVTYKQASLKLNRID